MAARPCPVALGLVVALGLPAAPSAQVADGAVRFLTVNQGPNEFKADEVLSASLSGLVASPQKLAYNEVVEDIVSDETRGGTVARLTPYAFVVAEMMGARLDLLATYSSRSTGSTTYNSYFVVRRDALSGPAVAEPSLAQLLDVLRERSRAGQPARFIYHDQLSTSSYFVPSLYFRKQRVFAQNRLADRDVTAVVVARHDTQSSSALVHAVAGGAADLAAVWDGTRAPFQIGGQSEAVGQTVWFLKLPSDLPCDLLVATAKVDDATKSQIRERLAGRAREVRERRATSGGAMQEATGPGDVDYWVPWADSAAERARTALSFLRREAMAPPAPVVVEVTSEAESPVTRAELEAVRQAIRLAGTEFVPKHEYFDYYKQREVAWRLSRIHDGAVRLTVEYDHFKLAGQTVTQEFTVSYVALDDLTRRVAALLHSRMHRVRQVWLYKDRVPTIVRDVEFEVPAGTALPLQEIEWSDPERNDFTVQATKDIALRKADFFTFAFDSAPFPKRGDTTLDFEPMGRTAYRVLLMRPERERALFKALTVALVALFALAAGGLCWDLRRSSRRSLRRPPLRALDTPDVSLAHDVAESAEPGVPVGRA